MTHLVLVNRHMHREERRPTGLFCQRCSDHFGVPFFRPKVTTRPQSAIRLPSGAIVIEDPTVLCAHCLERGIETVL